AAQDGEGLHAAGARGAAAGAGRRRAAVARRSGRAGAELRRGVGAARADPVGGAAARRGPRGVLAVPRAVAQGLERAGDRAAAQRAAVMRVLGIESSCDETAAAIVE